jgi:hypothetical protein
LEIEAHITASVTVPGEVRALLRRLRGDLSARVYENARLLASEVATNAVLHGARGAPIRFHAELDDCLRIQIRNHSGVDRPVVATGDVSKSSRSSSTLLDWRWCGCWASMTSAPPKRSPSD